jgi:hypothetical protein
VRAGNPVRERCLLQQGWLISCSGAVCCFDIGSYTPLTRRID